MARKLGVFNQISLDGFFADAHNDMSFAKNPLEDGDAVSEIRKLKAAQGRDLMILGSGSLVSQLTQARLIDEYQLMIVPVVLGAGRTLFEGANGNIFGIYEM